LDTIQKRYRVGGAFVIKRRHASDFEVTAAPLTCYKRSATEGPTASADPVTSLDRLHPAGCGCLLFQQSR
jgi:hypothetical protein